jgi:YHS domain-containing protein
MCEAHNHNAQSSVETESETAECPVMPGGVVNKQEAVAEGLYRDYEGARYYLCCDTCGPMFDAEPEKYAHA